MRLLAVAGAVLLAACGTPREPVPSGPPLRLSWDRNILTIRGEHLPGREMKILYIEAYCRPDSHTTDWGTPPVIGHSTEIVAVRGTRLELRCTLKDGVIVDHVIT